MERLLGFFFLEGLARNSFAGGYLFYEPNENFGFVSASVRARVVTAFGVIFIFLAFTHF